MFRHERPQKGRYRQFHQFSVEALGFTGPDIDAELIALTARLWKRLGIARVRLSSTRWARRSRAATTARQLVGYFRSHETALDEDSRRRLGGNPLRILDSKNPDDAGDVAGAPLLSEHLDAESRAHFERCAPALDALGIAYQGQSAAGARPRLLLAHRVRVDHRRAGFAERDLLRWPLRWPDRAARRRAHAGGSASRWAWSASWRWSSRSARRRSRPARMSI